jgi:hypothetical protein
MERLSRTPEGAMFLGKQQQGSRKVAERQQMIQPVPLGDTGQFIIPLTGQVINPETGGTRQMTPEEAQAMGLVPIESKNGVVTYGQPKAATTRGYQLIPGTYDDEGNLTPDRLFDSYTGETWNQGDPPPPAVTASRTAPSSASGASPKKPYNPFE